MRKSDLHVTTVLFFNLLSHKRVDVALPINLY